MTNIYVVDNNKQLKQTQKTNIYKDEFNIDSLVVLIPSALIDNIKNTNVSLCFIDSPLPCKTLVPSSNLYKGYFVFQTKIDHSLTRLSGDFVFNINCVGVNFKFGTGTAKFRVLERS